jgi:hypothetical protein
MLRKCWVPRKSKLHLVSATNDCRPPTQVTEIRDLSTRYSYLCISYLVPGLMRIRSSTLAKQKQVQRGRVLLGSPSTVVALQFTTRSDKERRVLTGCLGQSQLRDCRLVTCSVTVTVTPLSDFASCTKSTLPWTVIMKRTIASRPPLTGTLCLLLSMLLRLKLSRQLQLLIPR